MIQLWFHGFYHFFSCRLLFGSSAFVAFLLLIGILMLFPIRLLQSLLFFLSYSPVDLFFRVMTFKNEVDTLENSSWTWHFGGWGYVAWRHLSISAGVFIASRMPPTLHCVLEVTTFHLKSLVFGNEHTHNNYRSIFTDSKIPSTNDSPYLTTACILWVLLENEPLSNR